MKVLHIGKYFPPHRGGMETFLRDLMGEQRRQGLDAHALVHRSERSISSVDEAYRWGEQILLVTRAARWATLAFTPLSPMFVWHIWHLIRREAPDVLHLHMPNPSVFWCLLLPSARKIPWVIQWQSDVLPSPHRTALRLLYWLYRIPERQMLKASAAIIATSPPYLESSETLHPFRDKCHVVPLAIESEIDAPTTTRSAGTDRTLLKILSVGRLTYYKGHDVLIRAVAETANCTLTLVGDGEEYERLKALVGELGVNERVYFERKCSDHVLHKLYSDNDLLCMPSIERTESFGIVLLEAMRQSLPCAVSDVTGSGMQWVVGDGEAGVVFPPGDPMALARSLADLQRNHDKLKTFGRTARVRFHSMFLLFSCCASVSDVYALSLRTASVGAGAREG